MLIEFISDKPGEKLLRLINSNYPELSYNKINMLLRKKDIRINGKRVQDNVFVKNGDAIQLYLPASDWKQESSINIFYEDNNILIAEKPQDIEVEGNNSLTEYLKQSNPAVKPCHRLDRNTTGLLIFALNDKAYDEIVKAFNDRTVEKYYLALLCGSPAEKTAKISAYLFKDSRKSRVYISDNPGKGYVPITTEYTVLEEFNDLSLAEINLITGRTHQIRAHMAHIGHPVLGDGKYGLNEYNREFGVKNQQLFAYKIKFNFGENSQLKYLNDIDFENKLYLKDLQEFNQSLHEGAEGYTVKRREAYVKKGNVMVINENPAEESDSSDFAPDTEPVSGRRDSYNQKPAGDSRDRRNRNDKRRAKPDGGPSSGADNQSRAGDYNRNADSQSRSYNRSGGSQSRSGTGDYNRSRDNQNRNTDRQNAAGGASRNPSDRENAAGGVSRNPSDRTSAAGAAPENRRNNRNRRKNYNNRKPGNDGGSNAASAANPSAGNSIE